MSQCPGQSELLSFVDAVNVNRVSSGTLLKTASKERLERRLSLLICDDGDVDVTRANIRAVNHHRRRYTPGNRVSRESLQPRAALRPPQPF